MCYINHAIHSAELAASGGLPPFGALRHHLQPLAAPILDPDLQSQLPTTTFSGKAAVSRVDGIRLLCPPLTEPYVRFSRIRLLE